MVSNLTIGVHSARSGARVDAVPVPTDLRVSAFAVIQAAAAMTVGQRIALITGRTGADGSTACGLLATGTRSARTSGASLSCELFVLHSKYAKVNMDSN